MQTAYLKCHYTEEYMTALLSVQRDDLGKVATYLEECRRLNIDILPPDVNYSQLDFDIETTADGRRAIRFGLAAVKNASAWALRDLLAARGEAPFAGIVDFCQRVDLRKQGKRSMESLIKVGALDSFGTRATLIAALDGIFSYSSHYHRDQEVGQMLMFEEGAASDVELLKNIKQIEEHDARELLKWEKELIGLYLTGRPVDRHKETLAGLNLQRIADLKSPSLSKPENVKVAGEITEVRKLTTRKGELMAVISLEDWYDSAGIIEVVLFPQAYSKALDRFERLNRQVTDPAEARSLAEGEIVLVQGRFDESRGEPQIVADSLRTDFEVASAAETSPETLEHSGPPAGEALPPAEEPPPFDDDMFPPPEPYDAVPVDDSAAAPPKSAPAPAAPDEEEPEWVNGDGKLSMPGEEEAAPRQPRTISVVLTASDDPERDRRKLNRLHSGFVKYPGPDRFKIIIQRGEQLIPLNFPNQTTDICPALHADLVEIVGSDRFISIDDSD